MTLKIKYMSDLHIDVNETPFVDQTPEDSKEIVLVLAGDICEVDNTKRLVTFLHYICPKYRKVLYQFGNHEYYNGSINRAKIKLLEKIKDIDNLIFMDRNTVVIDDVTFVGATLWTDMNKGDPIFYLRADDKYTGMNDYSRIRWGTAENPYARRLRPQDVYTLHKQDLAYIKANLTYKTRKTVLVTHHAPCISITSKGKFGNHPLNPAYASQLEEFVAYSEIDLLIHGHVHDPYDIEFFGTRIVCNTRGYDESESRHFNPNAIIEL